MNEEDNMDELNRAIDDLYDLILGDHIAMVDIRERHIQLPE